VVTASGKDRKDSQQISPKSALLSDDNCLLMAR
jgi:hypothetical protein